MISRLSLAAALALGAGAAHADPRITERFYQPASVTTVHGRPNVETTIAFADDEHVENVAVGNSAAWQVTPNKRANLLFVKPAGARSRSNMTVVTDQRTYLFDLVSMAGAPVYMLRFTYPTVPKARLAALAPPPPAPPAIPPPAEPPAIETKVVAAPPVPPPLNFAWVAAGSHRLLPARTFDDGRATYLAWPKDAVLPAMLVRDASGQEGPVNFTVKDDVIVVDGVPAQIVLRQGKQMATLTPAPRVAAQAPAAVALADAGSARP